MVKLEEGPLPGSIARRTPTNDRQAWKRRACVALLVLALMGWWSAGDGRRTRRDGRRGDSDSDIDAWIEEQEAISYDKILRNIGPTAGAKDGLVIASPSRGEPGQPDYFYTWTRDSALTYNTLLHRFLPQRYLSPWTYTPQHGQGGPVMNSGDTHDLLLEPLFRTYIASQADLQTLHTPSGDMWSGGLNEPKFEADGGVFDGDWGRPQRDGPALRALTLIPYAHYLLDRNRDLDHEYVTRNLYDARLIRAHGRVIKNDLEEVARGWWMEGFDLWEEVNGHQLWTRLTSLRALQAGAILAARMNDPHAAEYYARSADRIEARLANFWVYESRHRGFWASSISGKNQLVAAAQSDENEARYDQGLEEDQQEELGNVTRDLDCGFVLSVLHAHSFRTANSTVDSSWTSFEPSHPGVLSTLRQLARSFDDEYPINGRKHWREGRLLGRYRGDEYDGTGKSQANPWFICTYAFAQALYLAHDSFHRAGIVHLSSHSSAFWSDVLDAKISHSDAVWARGDGLFEDALDKLWAAAEAYVRTAKKHVPTTGEMSEQIDRINGSQKGARDLTWSHASFLDLARTRRRAMRSKKAEGRSSVTKTRGPGVFPMGRTEWLPDLY